MKLNSIKYFYKEDTKGMLYILKSNYNDIDVQFNLQAPNIVCFNQNIAKMTINKGMVLQNNNLPNLNRSSTKNNKKVIK